MAPIRTKANPPPLGVGSLCELRLFGKSRKCLLRHVIKNRTINQLATAAKESEKNKEKVVKSMVSLEKVEVHIPIAGVPQ